VRSSFSARIVLAFVLFVALVAGAGAVVVVRLSSLRTSLELLEKGYLALSRVSTQLHTMQEGTDATVAQAMANDDPLAREGLVRAARRWSPAGYERHLAEMTILVTSLASPGFRHEDADCAGANRHRPRRLSRL
jgi:phage tail tape-measure protein